MRRLGKVLHISSMTGNLIVKAKTVPHIGEKVYDGERRLVGSVFDIFGSVKSPYVSVKPLHFQVKPVKVLFLSEPRRRKKCGEGEGSCD